MWVVSAAKLQPPFSSPALRSLHGRPDRSGSTRSTDLQSLSLSLSRPHLANDEAHALYHGYACSESTSASLRPKPLSSVLPEATQHSKAHTHQAQQTSLSLPFHVIDSFPLLPLPHPCHRHSFPLPHPCHKSLLPTHARHDRHQATIDID